MLLDGCSRDQLSPNVREHQCIMVLVGGLPRFMYAQATTLNNYSFGEIVCLDDWSPNAEHAVDAGRLGGEYFYC